jgi:hypothetical protein
MLPWSKTGFLYCICGQLQHSMGTEATVGCHTHTHMECSGPVLLITRLKRLPVISREHFRKTRTNNFFKHLFGISNYYIKCCSYCMHFAKYTIATIDQFTRLVTRPTIKTKQFCHLRNCLWTTTLA